jgi:hypothetical protein
MVKKKRKARKKLLTERGRYLSPHFYPQRGPRIKLSLKVTGDMRRGPQPAYLPVAPSLSTLSAAHAAMDNVRGTPGEADGEPGLRSDPSQEWPLSTRESRRQKVKK